MSLLQTMESSADTITLVKTVFSKVEVVANTCLQRKLECPVEEVQSWSECRTPLFEIDTGLKEILDLLQSLSSDSRDELHKKEALTVTSLILLIGEHRIGRNSGCHPWSSPNLVSLTDEALGYLLRIFNATDLNSFFLNDVSSRGNPRNSFLMGCLKSLRGKVSGKEWKHQPAAVEALIWIIQSIRHPAMSEFLSEVLPPTLILLDDYSDDYKLLGLDCLCHIVEEATKADLMRENWASVLLSALQSLLYDSNFIIVERVMEPVLFLLKITECDPNEFSYKFTQYDTLLRKVLTALECCTVPECKSVYVDHIAALVKIMKLATLHWRKRILEALLHLTATIDAKLMKAVLRCVNDVVRNTWVKPDSLNSAEVPLRILMNLSALDILSIQLSQKDELLNLCCESFRLFQQLDDYSFLEKEILSMIANKRLDSKFLLALNSILNQESQKLC